MCILLNLRKNHAEYIFPVTTPSYPKMRRPSIVGVVVKSIIFFYLVEHILMQIYRKILEFAQPLY